MSPEESKIQKTLREEVRKFFSDIDPACRETNIFREISEQTEKIIIEEALKISKNNQVKTAEIIGINRNTLQAKIKKYKIKSK